MNASELSSIVIRLGTNIHCNYCMHHASDSFRKLKGRMIQVRLTVCSTSSDWLWQSSPHPIMWYCTSSTMRLSGLQCGECCATFAAQADQRMFQGPWLKEKVLQRTPLQKSRYPLQLDSWPSVEFILILRTVLVCLHAFSIQHLYSRTYLWLIIYIIQCEWKITGCQVIILHCMVVTLFTLLSLHSCRTIVIHDTVGHVWANRPQIEHLQEKMTSSPVMIHETDFSLGPYCQWIVLALIMSYISISEKNLWKVFRPGGDSRLQSSISKAGFCSP